MKKLILSIAVIVVFAFYALWSSRARVQTSVATPITTDIPSPTPTPGTSARASPKAVTYKDGTFSGSVASTIYGNVQVRAVISGGRLTDVQNVQFPNDRDTSIEISNNALPLLKTEAIKAQSAKVNIVSGATQTSEGYQQSLAAALVSAAN